MGTSEHVVWCAPVHWVGGATSEKLWTVSRCTAFLWNPPTREQCQKSQAKEFSPLASHGSARTHGFLWFSSRNVLVGGPDSPYCPPECLQGRLWILHGYWRWTRSFSSWPTITSVVFNRAMSREMNHTSVSVYLLIIEMKRMDVTDRAGWRGSW